MVGGFRPAQKEFPELKCHALNPGTALDKSVLHMQHRFVQGCSGVQRVTFQFGEFFLSRAESTNHQPRTSRARIRALSLAVWRLRWEVRGASRFRGSTREAFAQETPPGSAPNFCCICNTDLSWSAHGFNARNFSSWNSRCRFQVAGAGEQLRRPCLQMPPSSPAFSIRLYFGRM